MPKICEFETCRKEASYGEYYGKPIRCRKHKEEYKLVSQLCQQVNCMVFSSYNYDGETKSIFCFQHKKNNMINIKHKICCQEGCKTCPNYNFEGEKNGLYCTTHKKEGMVNVTSKMCIQENCKLRSNYNFEGENIALYCSSHKKEGMINVTSKMCLQKGCKICPNYNFKGETIALYCLTHKKEGMVNIKLKKCIYEGCNICPNYNFEEETSALYCSTHKKEGMIDVNAKMCIENGCKTIAIYNFEGEKEKLYCSKHRKEGMINIKSKKCIYNGCNIFPNYNFQGYSEGLYCLTHKKEEMVDVKHKKCKGNFCLGTIANPKYKGYCASCYQHLFPNDPLTLQMRSKTKEIAVRDFINSNFEGFQHDKPLWSGNCDCTHRRKIDHRKLIGNTLLCIETDEEQHKGYHKKDEEIRYDDLFMLHGGKFIYIRFNPDKFKNKDSKTLNPMLYTRLPVLKEEIERQIERIKKEENTELLEIIKLYYNE